MRIMGDIEVNKTTLWIGGITLGFVAIVFFTLSLHSTFLSEEWKAYRDARRMRTIEAYQAYLRVYPEGRYVRRVHDDLEGMYAAEYAKCLSFMNEQAQAVARIIMEYGIAGIRARAIGDVETDVVEEYQNDLEIDGTLKSLSEGNKAVDRFLQYGAFKGSRYVDVHAAAVEAFQAYLKLYQLAMNPAAVEGDYNEAAWIARSTFSSLKQSASLLLSQVSRDISHERAQRLQEGEKKSDY